MKNLPSSKAPPPWIHALARCAERFDVDWIGQSDPRYEEARLLYNRFHDLYPAALVRTRDANSVSEIIRFASDHGVALAIRGGGHHIAGYGSCDGGIVIDFSPFRNVEIDPASGTIEVEPGTRLGDVDRKLCPRGMVVPTGTVSETGIAGLTLGGGIGWLVGRYGLTCDHLIGADVVLADGRQVRAEDPNHTDLLWALRGGGGNFGVVVRLRYRALPLPLCIAGSMTVALEHASASLERMTDFLENFCPRDLTVAPTFARSVTGEPILSVDFCLAGENESILRRLFSAVEPRSWAIRYKGDFPAWQQSFDALFQPPMRGYWKARYGLHLTKYDIDTLVRAFACAPIDQSAILIEHLHGAFVATGNDAAAFPLRWARFGVLLSARWQDPAKDETAIAWVRESFARLDPSNTSAAYSNYTADDDPRAISTFENGPAVRLAEVKRLYDPSNIFSRNHNFRPNGSVT